MIWEVFNGPFIGNADMVIYAKQYIKNKTNQ